MLAPKPGTELDGFRLGEKIHVGTMAWIFRLMGPEGPLPLIMKIPKVGLDERPANVVSFEVERTVLGALAQGTHHPTLVAYGDVETTPYLVMEHIEGTRLQDWIQRAPLPPEETARLGHAFALALHDIHRQDVIHLDLKSTNVLYRASGEAALIDFGLSNHRHYPDLLAEEFRFPVGNWSYMSPEQVLGVRCDPRSDVFALGALLYELATGKQPFGLPKTVAQLRQRLYRDPVPPRAIVAATPDWLQEIILHCLEVDGRDRYASAAQVAFDLANPDQVELTQRGERRRRAGWASLARRWMRAKNFEPAPCPPPSTTITPAPIVLVAIPSMQTDEALFEALRDAVRRQIAAHERCRVACITVVPPAAALSDDTPTGRHIKHLVNLRRWAKPLGLPEERLTYHVLESEKPAVALIDFASMNDVDQILIGAPRSAVHTRWSAGVPAQVVAGAPCSVTAVRPRSDI
ncbi:MAG TPA: bifunctional serine/threonine-protein kinase/universal stress protein [Burkholderiales bacterium]|nr:bifunctional serine/threonine-protein kinase/universal stress protein [Burkholderiales bacterium]